MTLAAELFGLPIILSNVTRLIDAVSATLRNCCSGCELIGVENYCIEIEVVALPGKVRCMSGC